MLANCKHGSCKCAGGISLTNFLSVVDDLGTHPELTITTAAGWLTSCGFPCEPYCFRFFGLRSLWVRGSRSRSRVPPQCATGLMRISRDGWWTERRPHRTHDAFYERSSRKIHLSFTDWSSNPKTGGVSLLLRGVQTFNVIARSKLVVRLTLCPSVQGTSLMQCCASQFL